MLKRKIGSFEVSYNVERYLNQVLLGKEYDFLSFYPVVIDIGANIGTFSLFIYDKAEKIYALEPVEENLACLRQTIADNNLTKIIPIQTAISDKSFVQQMVQDGDPGMGGWKLREDGDYPVHTLSLKDFMHTQGIEYADLVKIDVEGHEEQIFNERLFPKDRIGTIIGEWHNHIEPIQEKLEWLGYKFIDMGNNHFIARKI